MIEGIENAYPNYGLPKKKKYPLPDRKHVLSAIRFFNYVSPQDEAQLAEAILEKIKEYGMKDVGVGPDNRFLKYYKKDADHLEHHGILGQKWGVRRFQNPDGTLTEDGIKRYRKQIAGRGYLDPSLDDIHKGLAENREKVSSQYAKEYWENIAKGMPENSPSDIGRKLWNKYKVPYYKATLKDLNLQDTKKAREFVEKILEDTDPDFDYDANNPVKEE